MTETDLIHCSFCGKSKEEVRKIVAGPNVYICNECVELIQMMMNDTVPEEPPEDAVC